MAWPTKKIAWATDYNGRKIWGCHTDMARIISEIYFETDRKYVAYRSPTAGDALSVARHSCGITTERAQKWAVDFIMEHQGVKDA